MSGRRSSLWLRALRGGLAMALFLLLAGDRGTHAALIGGIDPLAILKLQVKNNVAIVFDSSGSMKWPVDKDDFSIGADDPLSRFNQAKVALRAVIQANVTRLNFGMLSYNVPASAKPLNVSQDFDNDSNVSNPTNPADDGPFIYVSVDSPVAATDAATYYNAQSCNGGATVDGFFCLINDTFSSYDTMPPVCTPGVNCIDVFRSFGNRQGTAQPGFNLFSDPYPFGCTPGVDCRYYLQSRLFRSHRSFTWNVTSPSNANTALVSTATITCPLPPAGATPDNPDADLDGFGDQPRPCIQFINNATGAVSTFFYTSAIFQMQSGSFCGGALALENVAPCTVDNSQAILDELRLELPADNDSTLGGGFITENAVLDYMNNAGDNPPVFGIRADQSTPIAGSIQYIHTNSPTPVFPPNAVPPPAPAQKNFVLILSDGDDTCANAGDQDGDGDSNDLDDRAIFSARQAEFLFENTGVPQRQAETLVVAFASAINLGRSNLIAQAGSGGQVQPGGTIFCPPGATCRNAFAASSTDELIEVLNQALDFVVTTGEFSAAPTILSTVFEMGPLDQLDPLPPTDPNRTDSMNPDTRYNSASNILFQPTFEMPGFKGHLYAFLNDGTFARVPQANLGCSGTGCWDAGQTLFEGVSQVLQAAVGRNGTNLFTFAELGCGPNTSAPCTSTDSRNIGSSAALIKRRIFTASSIAGTGGSPVNRTYTRTPGVLNEWDGSVPQGTNVVAVWPTSQTGLDSGITDIDPPVGTAGPLDDALGIGAGSNPVLTFADLKSKFRACEGSVDTGGPPTDCDEVANPTLALDTARKEARQILIAWIAGAQVAATGSDGLALRDTTTPQKELLFSDRGWLLLDTILGAPAIVGPPLRGAPSQHLTEFALFRDGRRSAVDQQGIDDIDRGFGLRNPDFDDANPELKPNLKPVMTVVYLPANDMLHAFRAGPNCGPASGQVFDPTTCTEEGAQELWGFMPLDQLGKIQTLFAGQLIDPHTYTMATSVRVSDIFIPGAFSLVDNGVSVDYEGRWRTVLYLGRGPGGKFYTALDVTAPGPFTDRGLDTNPPFVMWNHGNEDPVAGVDPTSDDDYDEMGQSWSVPAVGNVDSNNPGIGLPEWRVWTGSGYGDTPTEGKTFYMLDAETGAVLYAKFVGDGLQTFFPDNALVASPSAYNPFQLEFPGPVRSADFVSRVYVPDIHGRIWKFNTTSGGQVHPNPDPAQPIGVPVALLKINSNPLVFAEAGNDERVPDDNNHQFKMFGFEDGAADTDLSTPLSSLFELLFPAEIPGISEAFRGTVQPATAFSEDATGGLFGRVFFVGTRFNQTTSQCLSSFDTILFGVGALSGNAVYDFNNDGSADLSTIIQGTRATNVAAAGGQVYLGDSGGMNRPPSPPPPPSALPSPKAAQPAQVLSLDLKPGSPVCKVQ